MEKIKLPGKETPLSMTHLYMLDMWTPTPAQMTPRVSLPPATVPSAAAEQPGPNNRRDVALSNSSGEKRWTVTENQLQNHDFDPLYQKQNKIKSKERKWGLGI